MEYLGQQCRQHREQHWTGNVQRSRDGNDYGASSSGPDLRDQQWDTQLIDERKRHGNTAVQRYRVEAVTGISLGRLALIESPCGAVGSSILRHREDCYHEQNEICPDRSCVRRFGFAVGLRRQC